MNSFQFNIYLGLLTLVGYVIPPSELVSFFPSWLLALGLLILYGTDYWAFGYKIRISRARSLYELSGGDPTKKVGELGEPGCMLFYAFLIRFVFRFAMIMFTFILLFGEMEELPTWMIVLMCVVVLFELFHMMYSLFESHIFRMKSDDDDDESTFWEKEAVWRKRMFERLSEINTPVKVVLADLVLLISGTFATALFWDGANRGFVDFIIQSGRSGESVLFVVVFVVLASAVLCLFFLLPVRLAFWLEQRMNVFTEKDKLKYRLSVFFAGVSITAPSLIQLVKTYLFNA